MANRYQPIEILKTDKGIRYYKNNVYPEIQPTDNDIYVITTMGDRLDLLAYDYYQDTSLWWIIASANSLPGDSLFIEPGTQLRIPANVLSAINEYNLANQ